MTVNQKKTGLREAIDQSFNEIIQFLNHNKDKLALQDKERVGYKEQTQRRIEDLDVFCRCASQNYLDLTEGMKQGKACNKTL